MDFQGPLTDTRQPSKVGSARAYGDDPIGNAVIQHQGVCDPHIRIFQDKAWMFSTHDYGKGERLYKMMDWQLFSSTDLVTWKKEFVLRPEDTFLGPCCECYAPEGATRGGKYYFYFSDQQRQTGVAVSDRPEGPYLDALGKPLLPPDLAPTASYDPAVFIDDDCGRTPYILWGYTVFGKSYHMARLNEDMISLAEPPREIVIQNCWENDAIALHKQNGVYYLNSHEGAYATAANVYGPYTSRGRYTKLYADHGSFFQWHNQTFTSFGLREDWSDPFYRTTKITYAHYRDNGEILADDWISNANLGVGQYDARWPKIEAEWFFAASDGLEKRENTAGFEIRGITDNAFLCYPKVRNLGPNPSVGFHVSSAHPVGGTTEVREGGADGRLLGICRVLPTGSWNDYRTFSCQLHGVSGLTDLCLVFKGTGGELMRFDWFAIHQKEQ